jgi:hypothetical protein
VIPPPTGQIRSPIFDSPAPSVFCHFVFLSDAGAKFNGIVFFLDKEGKVFRTDVHMKDRQTGVAGIFELKLDNPGSKELTGTATATAGRSDKLEVAFHATLK